MIVIPEIKDILNAFVAVCPGCKTNVSSLLHDFSLCTELRNAEWRIRQLEEKVKQLSPELS